MHGCLPADPQRAIFLDPTSGIEKVEAERAAAAAEIHSTSGIFGPSWFAAVAARMWPDERKRSAAVHAFTGAPNTTCFRWHSGTSEIASRFVLRILWSAAGWLFLNAAMRGCKAQWWVDVQRGLALLRAVEAEQRRFSEQLELGLE